MNKEQHLTYELGITNVPGDATCDDNGLEESLGMVYDNGEHRVIQKPEADGTVDGTLVFVHGDRRIYTKNDGVNDGVYYNNEKICDYNGTLSITAIGNTLVMSHDDGVVYAKWKGSEQQYEYFSGLPEITFTPLMVNIAREETYNASVTPLHITDDVGNPYQIGVTKIRIDSNGSYTEDVHMGVTGNAFKLSLSTSDEPKKNFQTMVIGVVEEYLNKLKEDGYFVYPFWVRLALELYDGSITKHTPPILMCPSVRNGVCVALCKDDGSNPSTYQSYENIGDSGDYVKGVSNIAKLVVHLSCDSLEGYDDIINGVKIYVSREVRTEWINDEKWDFYNPIDNELQYAYDFVGISGKFYPTDYTGSPLYERIKKDHKSQATSYTEEELDDHFFKTYIVAPPKSDKEIMKELIETSVFYELCSIPYGDLLKDLDENRELHKFYNTKELMEHKALLNLDTLTQMPHDDYYSHTAMSGGKLYAYNSRINLFDVMRKAFDGFDVFITEVTNQYKFRVFVHITTDTGVLVVKNEFDSVYIQGYFFFYPDPRAKRVEMYILKDSGWRLLVDTPLNEHPYLNGAYAFIKLPYDTGSIWNPNSQSYSLDKHYDSVVGEVVSSFPTVDNLEDLPNTIITSEVNNPFVFYAEGSNKVGNGRIIGLATQTVALSDGTEFGKQPLIVFTDKGLWSLTVSNEGLYATGGPMPREVCNNPNSITEVDGAVFFSSAKGLMMIVGSQVKCVSEQLSGKSDAPFTAFLKDAFIAYDYRDSLLWIFDGIVSVCWIYNIKSGTFARYDFGSNNIIDNVVADYPDYLLQSGSNIFSLIKRDNINDDDTAYAGQIITRPLKLESGLMLKSIMRMRNIYELNDNGSLSVSVFAKNDLNSAWTELTHLRGTPWKYYQLRYNFTNLKATDNFAGTVLLTQERRTNKLR